MAKKIWDFFDGKKTSIGALLLFAAGFEHLPSWIGQDYVDLIFYIGTALAGIGTAHRIAKGR